MQVIKDKIYDRKTNVFQSREGPFPSWLIYYKYFSMRISSSRLRKKERRICDYKYWFPLFIIKDKQSYMGQNKWLKTPQSQRGISLRIKFLRGLKQCSHQYKGHTIYPKAESKIKKVSSLANFRIFIFLDKGLPHVNLGSRLGFFSVYPVNILDREFSIWFHFFSVYLLILN